MKSKLKGLVTVVAMACMCVCITDVTVNAAEKYSVTSEFEILKDKITTDDVYALKKDSGKLTADILPNNNAYYSGVVVHLVYKASSGNVRTTESATINNNIKRSVSYVSGGISANRKYYLLGKMHAGSTSSYGKFKYTMTP